MSFSKWSRIYYSKMVESIAFFPAVIAVGFLILSWLMLLLDFSPFGKEIKSGLSWLSLKDASTARTIISTVAGAIISLTVFSFSMVMIVLNQAASQMSNRVLNSMIENRFQQVILGIYIGTIVYALFLLSTIRDISSGIYVPALSIYLLIVLTVIDIFLFIYFLDYVTQTVKYETVIDRVKNQTFTTMIKDFEPRLPGRAVWEDLPSRELLVLKSGYFQGFSEKTLLSICEKNDVYISFYFRQGKFLLEKLPFLKIYSEHSISTDLLSEISDGIDFYNGQPIDRSADYGFHQLAEIALKALSPGINDPATAVISLHSLAALLQYKMKFELPKVLFDEKNTARIFRPVSSFEENFQKCIPPIWNYGKDDQYIQNELFDILAQLQMHDEKVEFKQLLDHYKTQITEKRKQSSNKSD